jgi:hypothetical protein
LQAHLVPLFPDLLGFRPVPRERALDWTLFFDAPGATTAQRCKKIDGKLVRALIELPVAVTGECEIEDHHSLAFRDLQRGQGVGLPSGESVARHGISRLAFVASFSNHPASRQVHTLSEMVEVNP